MPHGRRARPLTEQIQVIRELWLLREQARVQAAERRFLTDLERLLSSPHSEAPPPPPPPWHMPPVSGMSPPPPPPPPLPPAPGSPGSVEAFPPAAPSHARTPRIPPSTSPPRPAREHLGAVDVHAVELLARQPVTNLSPHFRALLEGTAPPPGLVLARSRSFGQLSQSRTVSTALESEFRHRLESLLVRREHRRQPPQLRHMYRSTAGSYVSESPHLPEPHDVPYSHDAPRAAELEVLVRALREEVTVLKNVISASFDLQLDIQRSIRQEVAAAMSTPAMVTLGKPAAMQDTSTCTVEPSAVGDTTDVQLPNRRSEKALSAGCCAICMEASIDSLLYACGHMCTCSMCGRQLVASGQSCPICRAPVRDVVRAFMVTE